METTLTETPGVKAIRLLSDWIARGVLAAGSPLPSERQLSKQMEVSLTTVKRAIRTLEAEGWIERRGARDRVVGGPGKDSSLSLLRNSIAIVSDSTTPFTAPFPSPQGCRGGGGFLSYIANGAGNAVQAAGFHALSLHPRILAGDEMERLVKQGLRGFVVSEVSEQPNKFGRLLERLREARVPFAVFGNNSEYQGYDRVVSDHETGGYQLTRFLIGKGCRRILCALSLADHYWVKARHAGYLRAMAEAGLEPLPLLEQGPILAQTDDPGLSFEIRSRYVLGCLHPFFHGDRPLDGILAINDRNAFEIGAACRSLRKASDPRILITGYDGSFRECWERDFDPAIPVATMDKQNYEMGGELVRLLLDRIDGRLPASPQVRMTPPVLLPLQ